LNARSLTVRQVAVATREEPRALAPHLELGFPIRVLGQNQAPIVPKVVGEWWMEPFRGQTKLPRRAQQRLDAVLASGIALKDVVIFHELPGEPKKPSPVVKAVSIALRVAIAWAKKRITEEKEAAAARRREREWWERRDPCLVVVLEDGTWVEIDRWYD
jgi:hypothetical protein